MLLTLADALSEVHGRGLQYNGSSAMKRSLLPLVRGLSWDGRADRTAFVFFRDPPDH